MLQHGRITIALAIATTGFALTATPAGAQPAGDVVEPATLPQPLVRADVVEPSRAQQSTPGDFRSPDARDAADGGYVSGSPAVDLRSPDTRDVSVGRRPQAVVQTPVVRIVSTGSGAHGFDWGDAGIGAGGAIALVLLALGGVMLVAHRRHEHEGPSGPSALAS